MAEVILKNIKKIYPHQEPKKKKKGEPEKKTNLQITEEGVLAVDNFNLHRLLIFGEYGEACRRHPYCHCGAKMDLEDENE